MNQGAGHEGLPVEVLRGVASVVAAEVTPLGRLPGGVNAGVVRVQVAGRADAVLKAEPWAHPGLARGGSHRHPRDHWAFAWRVVTGREPVVAALWGYSSAVSALVERSLAVCADVPPPSAAPDMVHADLNPGNVLVREGAVVAVVDIGNAGSGSRVTDLTTVLWHAVDDALDGVRGPVWTKILDVVGWQGAAVLTATRVLMELEWPLRLALHDLVPQTVERGHRALDELDALR